MSEDLNWDATWNVLKSQQGRRCTSLKKSKALIFRIKCLNKLLPTRDICYLRRPKLYQGDTCIACFIAKETFSHLAECIIYQRIWLHTEAAIIEELGLKLLEKWNIFIPDSRLKEVFLGRDLETQIKRRKLHIRGLTNKSQFKEVRDLVSSNSKANWVIFCFIDIFWTNFFEKLWKFRCEVMSDWEKEKGINLRKKKARKKGKYRANPSNKENNSATVRVNKESVSMKDERI